MLLCFGNILHAQEAENFPPQTNPPIVTAVESKEKITVDGKLDESIWNEVPEINDFFKIEPRQGGKYLYKTSVKVIFDKKNLYFGVFSKDSVGKKGIRVQDLRRDFKFGENDVFFLQLDPQNLNRFCVSFQTTPYGNQKDSQVFDGTFVDNDWDALWKVRTSITENGYYAEFAIPFKSIRYDDNVKQDSLTWGITFSRLARRDYEQTVFPAIPQSFSPYRMNYAAKLKGLKLPPASANIRLQPYSLLQTNTTTNSKGEIIKNTDLKIGGEFKWAINPNSVLDVTFNTDFAQADVDRAVNNLTRFNVFFPERRQFFLENNGVYAGSNLNNIKPFFSRTIGLENSHSNSNPLPIQAGLRYTDRNKNRTISGLYVRQDEGDLRGNSNFMVARYLKNYGKQNNIGVMLTHRLDEENIEKGFKKHNNTTLTLDGLIRPKDETTISYLTSISRNDDNNDIGFAGNITADWSPNKLYLRWKTDFVDEKYKPGMGFVYANNTIKHNLLSYYIWRPKGKLGKLMRRWDPGVSVNWFQNSTNLKTQELSFYVFPIYIITASNGQIEYSFTPTYQNFDFSFSILGRNIEKGNYNYVRQFVRYKTDASKKISLQGKYEWGNYYNGKLNSVDLSTRYAPIPHIALTASYQHNKFKNFGITGDNFETDLFTAGLRLAANPRIQFSGFYQYNTFDKQARWNMRGSWEFAPLSFLYLVFNENNFNNSPVQNQNFITKLTFLKQF